MQLMEDVHYYELKGMIDRFLFFGFTLNVPSLILLSFLFSFKRGFHP